MKAMQIKSPAFGHDEFIPPRFTCDGENISPPIHWENVPGNTKSLALIMEDPDIPIPRIIMPVWTHWIVYNIPPSENTLPESFRPLPSSGSGIMVGVNSYRKRVYGGPCPPFGTHRYVFKLHALDIKLDVTPQKTNRKRLLRSMDNHILATCELVGRYRRNQ